MKDLVSKFEAYLLTEKRVAANTFAAYKNDLDQLVAYLEKNAIVREAVTPEVIKNFIYHVSSLRVSARTLSRKISSLKIFFSYLEERFGFSNCAQELTFPKLEKRLPAALSEQELEKLFETADADRTDIGFRNKVMLYLLYVSGMRISELVNTTISDVHFDTGFLSVTGKGGKGRLIPLPQPMLALLDQYLKTTHRTFVDVDHGSRATDFLFPTLYAGKVKAITRQSFWLFLRQLWEKSGITRHLSPHTLRHSFATHMLSRGADLRSLQLLLGHENIGTVQIYTHVETSYLREMYDKKHPRS